MKSDPEGMVRNIIDTFWSFGSSFNRNTRNFARALLILLIIGFILAILGTVTYWSIISSIINELNTFTSGDGALFWAY